MKWDEKIITSWWKWTHPKGYVRQKCVSRAQLPANVTIRWRYTQRATPKNKRRKRDQQRCHRIFDFVKKVIKNPTVRALGWQAVKHLPGLYNAATSQIKNDKESITIRHSEKFSKFNCKQAPVDGRYIKHNHWKNFWKWKWWL